MLKGFSPKLRCLARTHRVALGAIHDIPQESDVTIEHVGTDEQAADIFTKALEPQKWGPALKLRGMQTISDSSTGVAVK